MWSSGYFAETTIFYAGLFCKHFVFFKAHPLPKEQEVFQYRTKSARLNHPGISAVSHFQKQLLDFPSTIAHGSTAGPFKNHFSQTHLFFLKQNTNCHTTPDSSIPVDTDYSNWFELCAEGYTLPTSPALRSHDQ
jgi:hypothetical protein